MYRSLKFNVNFGQQRSNSLVSSSFSLFSGICFVVLMAIYICLFPSKRLNVRMNKPFISEAKRIIDFATTVPFEDVYTHTHTYTYKPNISLKFCCLLFVSKVNGQNKQQKCRLGFNFWNFKSNSLNRSFSFVFRSFALSPLFINCVSPVGSFVHSMGSKNAWWKHPHPPNKSSIVKLHSMLASLSNHLSLFSAMLICVSFTSGATLFASSACLPTRHPLRTSFSILFLFLFIFNSIRSVSFGSTVSRTTSFSH